MDDDKQERDDKPVRIELDQWERIATLAKKERRTVQAQAGVLIEEALAARSTVAP